MKLTKRNKQRMSDIFSVTHRGWRRCAVDMPVWRGHCVRDNKTTDIFGDL